MARNRGSARPSAVRAPPRAAPQQQTRSASTTTVPAKAAPPPPPPTVPQAAAPPAQGPGLFGQMASTAAGVAVGSTVGHVLGAGITSMFGGGSSAPAEAAPAEAAAPAQANKWGDNNGISCEADAKNFTKCLDEHQGNMQICNWYLDQLKACQKMAKESM